MHNYLYEAKLLVLNDVICQVAHLVFPLPICNPNGAKL